jgi:hypothetical protein
MNVDYRIHPIPAMAMKESFNVADIKKKLHNSINV